MIYNQITDWTTMVVLTHVIRTILESHFPESEVEKLFKDKIEVVFNVDNQIPIELKIWIKNNGRKSLQVYEIPEKFRKTISEIKTDIIEENRENGRKAPLKDKVDSIIYYTIYFKDDKSGYSYFEDELTYYNDDPDQPLIKEKLNNIIKLLNEGKVESAILDEYEEFVEIDLDEIWDMI